MISADRRLRLPLILVVFALAWPAAAAAQTGPPPDGHGGGEFVFRDTGPHLTEEQREEIRRAIERNVERLLATGKLPPALDATIPLDWPLRLAPGLGYPGYHGISNFVDQDAAFPGLLLDYNCGERTYDLASGYNHKGVDYFSWPFPWLRMDHDEIQVVAAAPGVVVLRQDGNFDRSCGFNSNPWNAVYVRHADGSTAWYGHMKNGSVTPKGVGDMVAAGERLGVVGSSGSSTGPHLHLEVYDAAGQLNDPYQGPCNTMNPATWWMAQRPYHDSALNTMTTGFAAPGFGTCPNPESPNTRSAFDRGNPLYVTAYYRDQLLGQVSQYRLRRPDGTIQASWSHSSPVSHYAASWWYWYWNSFAPFGPDGVWTFEIDYLGQTRVIPFVIGSAPAGRIPGDRAGEEGLTVTRSGAAAVTLQWSPSCQFGDTDYEVYEGVLGSFDSHVPRACSTGGSTQFTLTPSGEDVYFLIVPANGSREGSHGLDGTGAQRSPGPSTCLPVEIGPCGS